MIVPSPSSAISIRQDRKELRSFRWAVTVAEYHVDGFAWSLRAARRRALRNYRRLCDLLLEPPHEGRVCQEE